jgi:hypothetical protein
MQNNSLRIIFLTAGLLVFFTFNLAAQHQSVNEYTGNWADANSWSAGGSPLAAGMSNGTTIEIRGYITLNSDFRLENQSDLIIDGGDTLVILGNFTSGNKCDVIIRGGGVFVVIGSYTSSQQLFTTNNGILIIDGNVSITSNKATSSGSGEFYTSDTNADFGNTSGGATSPMLITDLNNNGDPGDQSMYDFITGGGSGTLPVEVVYFESKAVGQKAELSWATEMEINFDYFEILHSTDKENWQTAGTVKGHGNSNDYRTYSFTHENPAAGVNLYALKAVDLDGTFEMHGVTQVNIEGRLQRLKTFPNPVTDNQINFSNYDLEQGDLNVKVLNRSGQVVLTKLIDEQSNTVRFDEQLAKGVYILVIEQNNQKEYRKIIVR